VLADHQKLVDSPARHGAGRIIRTLAQHLVHHHGVGHRRIDRAKAILAVQPFLDEGDRGVDRARAQLLRKQRLDRPQDAVEAPKQIEPARALMRRLGGHPDRMRRLQKQLVDADTADVLGAGLQRRQHHQRHDGGPRPIGNLVEVERRPHRQQHDFDRQYRYAAPGQHAEHRQHETREDVAVDGAAARANRLPRPRHVLIIGGISDHLQREIGLHAGAHVESAVMHQRPAAMGALNPAQVVGDLALKLSIDGLAEVMAKQHILRGDGAIGLQFEHQMSVRLPVAEQTLRRRGDARLQGATAFISN
jgi:hypothetical protein